MKEYILNIVATGLVVLKGSKCCFSLKKTKNYDDAQRTITFYYFISTVYGKPTKTIQMDKCHHSRSTLG